MSFSENEKEDDEDFYRIEKSIIEDLSHPKNVSNEANLTLFTKMLDVSNMTEFAKSKSEFKNEIIFENKNDKSDLIMGPNKKLSVIVVDTLDIDVINDEAIMKDNKCIGYVTSGGYAHYIKKSIALGYIPTKLAKKDISLKIEINGKFYSGKIIDQPLYDPSGLKMRS